MRGIVAERHSGRRAADAVKRRLARAFVLSGLCLLLTGCYVMQAASGQLDVMAHSHPIPQVLADPGTPEATRKTLQMAQEARTFAVHELGLPDSDSYRKYADLGREYAVWNVVATPEFSVRPLRWCFPIAGCVAYRGYFHEPAAESLARKLTTRGDDAIVEGVPTYSTLGHLPDPLMSTMLGWRETRLVGTIFHELAHERLYVAGDSEFNEAFATVVEDAGVRRWLVARGEERELAGYDASRRRHADFVAMLREARAELARLYASTLSPDEMRVEKERVFGRLKFAYEQLRQRWGGYAGYDAWFAHPLNNARLASVATYQDCVPGLQRELAAAGSLQAFYARADEFAKLKPAARRVALCGTR